VDVGEVGFRDLRDYVERTFRHVAENKRLDFEVQVAPNVPRAVHTDAKRLQQIIKNLLSNAFKFTEKGKVALEIFPAVDGWAPDHAGLNAAKGVVGIRVRDTGIGIPPEKQQIIFEAFQQADGSTSRKYGGTGLGLAISREIAGLLGGEIKLHSTPGEGSAFTLYIPQSYTPSKQAKRQLSDMDAASHAAAAAAVAMQQQAGSGDASAGAATSDQEAASFDDDASNLSPEDQVLLVVENEANFARFLVEVGREHGFKVLVATRGSAALQIAREVRPHAITLDINLPDIDGWRILHRLKNDPATRHIPVQMITTEEDRERGLRMGAMGALNKPVKTKELLDQTFERIKACAAEQRARRILVVEPDEASAREIADLVGGADDVQVAVVPTGADALASAREQSPDLIVTGLDLPDRKGFDLIDEVKEDAGLRDVPLLVYTRRELSKREETHLKRLTQTAVLKDVRSPERLLDEATLFLHRKVADLPEEKRQVLDGLYQAGTTLAGKKVLIVDDDIRNIFAMTTLLEPHKMQILSAETGKSALDVLQANPDIDVVLMDIMMPDMDGYDTMRAVRKLSKFRALPIIALTAKAMKGDREKCIEAGASDYIAKPVDTEQLLSLLRLWLYR
jgi:CheY-like chemotaxis protein